jgi:hypothetical protein
MKCINFFLFGFIFFSSQAWSTQICDWPTELKIATQVNDGQKCIQAQNLGRISTLKLNIIKTQNQSIQDLNQWIHLINEANLEFAGSGVEIQLNGARDLSFSFLPLKFKFLLDRVGVFVRLDDQQNALFPKMIFNTESRPFLNYVFSYSADKPNILPSHFKAIVSNTKSRGGFLPFGNGAVLPVEADIANHINFFEQQNETKPILITDQSVFYPNLESISGAVIHFSNKLESRFLFRFPRLKALRGKITAEQSDSEIIIPENLSIPFLHFDGVPLQSINGSRNKNLIRLTVEKSKISRLKSSAFNLSVLKYLYLYDNPVDHVDANAFPASLDKLFFTASQCQNLASDSFRNLNVTQDIHIELSSGFDYSKLNFNATRSGPLRVWITGDYHLSSERRQSLQNQNITLMGAGI